MENLATKSDDELRTLLETTETKLRQQATTTRETQAEAKKILAAREKHREWIRGLTAFTLALLNGIQGAIAKSNGNRKSPLKLDLPGAESENYIAKTPGYREVIQALSQKFGVKIKFDHSPEYSNEYATTYAFTTATITFGPPTGVDTMQDKVIAEILKNIAEA